MSGFLPTFNGGSTIDGVTVTGTPSVGQTIVATSGTTADWETPSSGFTAGGDLSGTSSVQHVININGNPVASTVLGSTQDGYVLTWVNGSAQYQAKPTATQFTAGGDLSGTATTQHVIKLNGNPISSTALGSAQDGYILTWVNGSSQIQALPMGSGAPSGAAGGDLGGTYPNPTVVSITGAAGVINVAATGNIITWNKATTAPGLKQADNTTNSATGSTTTIQAQNATGTNTIGGNLKLQSGSGTLTTTNDGYISFFNGTANTALINKIFANGTYAGLWLSPTATGAPTISNYAIASNNTATNIQASTTISNIINGTVTMAVTASLLTVSTATVQYITGVTAPKFNQADNVTASATGQTLTIQAQNATSTNTIGGNLQLQSGSGTLTTTNDGYINLFAGATNIASFNKFFSASTVGSLWLGSASAAAPASINYTLRSDGSSTVLNGTSVVSLRIGGAGIFSLSSTLINTSTPTIQYTTATVAPLFNQADNVTDSATGQTLTIQSQNATGVTTIGGNLKLQSGSGTLTTTNDGYISFFNGATNTMLVNKFLGLPGNTALWIGSGVAGAPTASNYTITSGAGTTIINGPSAVAISAGASQIMNLTAALITSTAATIQYTAAVTSPKFNQADNVTASATAQTLTVQAQNATGTTAIGGNLKLQSGTGTSQDGYVTLFAGTTQVGQLGTAGLNTLTVPATATGLTISQTIQASASNPNNITIAPQAPGASAASAATGTPGSFVVQVTAPVSTGDEGGIILKRNSTILAALRPDITSPTSSGCLYLSSAGQTSANYAVFSNGTSVILNSPSAAGTVVISNFTAPKITVATNTITYGAPTTQYATAVVSPKFNQADNVTASATGQTLTVQAQNATSTNTGGGNLNLTAGTGTLFDGYVQVVGNLGLGLFSQAMADAPQTISVANSINNVLIATGANTGVRALTITCPPAAGIYKIIRNNCTNFGITVQFMTGAATGTILPGTSAVVVGDGTNAIVIMTGT